MRRYTLRIIAVAVPIIIFIVFFVGITQRLGLSPFAALPIAALAAIIPGLLMNQQERHIGGTRLLTRSQATNAARERLQEDYNGEEGFRLWDLVKIPNEYKSKGIFVMGEQGSGKTVYLQYLIAEALKDPRAKFVIHDFKMDLHPFLTKHLNIPQHEVKILHPYHQDSCGWDVQSDMRSEGNARGIATALIPDPPPQADPFWSDNARHIVKAALCFFFYKSEEHKGYKWGLRELVELLKDSEALKEIINTDDRLNYARPGINRANNDVIVTVLSHIAKLETIAMMWSHKDVNGTPTKELVSFRDWRRGANSPRILVLGTDENYGDECETLNRILWTQLKREVLDQSVKATNDIWFFLDEFYWMGTLDGIEKISSVARSRRVNLVVAAQDINQVREVYKEHKTNILMQNLSTKVFFRCSSNNAATFAAEEAGKQKILRPDEGTSTGPGGFSVSETERQHVEGVLMPEDIKRLKKCTAHKPVLDAVITTFIDDPFRYAMGFDAFKRIWPAKRIEEDYKPEDRRDRMKPRPLTTAERMALGIPTVKERAKDQDRDQRRQRQPRAEWQGRT